MNSPCEVLWRKTLTVLNHTVRVQLERRALADGAEQIAAEALLRDNLSDPRHLDLAELDRIRAECSAAIGVELVPEDGLAGHWIDETGLHLRFNRGEHMAKKAKAGPTPKSAAHEVEISRRCRICGCTEDTPCPGGCCWVEDPEMGDLCSACVGRAKKKAKAGSK